MPFFDAPCHGFEPQASPPSTQIMAQLPHWPLEDREEKWTAMVSIDDKHVCMHHIPLVPSSTLAVAHKSGATLAAQEASMQKEVRRCGWSVCGRGCERERMGLRGRRERGGKGKGVVDVNRGERDLLCIIVHTYNYYIHTYTQVTNIRPVKQSLSLYPIYFYVLYIFFICKKYKFQYPDRQTHSMTRCSCFLLSFSCFIRGVRRKARRAPRVPPYRTWWSG